MRYHHYQVVLSLSLSLSLSLFIYPSHPWLLKGLQDGILCPHRTGACKSFQVAQHWHLNVQGSRRESRLWVHLYFSNNAPHILFLIRWCFIWWEVSGRIISVLMGAACWTYSKQHTVFWCSSHLIFFTNCFLTSMWCIHKIVLTQL